MYRTLEHATTLVSQIDSVCFLKQYVSRFPRFCLKTKALSFVNGVLAFLRTESSPSAHGFEYIYFQAFVSAKLSLFCIVFLFEISIILNLLP